MELTYYRNLDESKSVPHTPFSFRATPVVCVCLTCDRRFHNVIILMFALQGPVRVTSVQGDVISTSG